MSETLKPCPFCGGTELTDDFTSGGYRWMQVRCLCGAQGPRVNIGFDGRDGMGGWDETRKRARAAWNRRAVQPEADARRLREFSVWLDARCDEVVRREGIGMMSNLACEIRERFDAAMAPAEQTTHTEEDHAD